MHDADDYAGIEADPADARQVDVLVALPQAKDEPEERGEQVSAPRGDGNARRLVIHPDGPDLRDGHQHAEYRHEAEDAPQKSIRLAAQSGSGDGIGSHASSWCT